MSTPSPGSNLGKDPNLVLNQHDESYTEGQAVVFAPILENAGCQEQLAENEQ